MAEFLLRERSEQWSFNYWTQNAPERKTRPYPDDLDDTAVALAALAGYDKSLVGGRELAAIAKLLTAVEVAPGGPYRTWLIKSNLSKWRDVDLAVNANVAYFLSFFDICPRPITQFIDEKIRSGDIDSPYYPSIIQIAYFISRTSKDEFINQALSESILHENDRDGLWRNPLENAMAISALVNLDHADKIPHEAILSLIEHLEKGAEAYPFCRDPSRDGIVFYAASPALTAAFCLEAITSFRQTLEPPRPGPAYPDIPGEILHEAKQLAHARTRSLPPDLRDIADREIASIKDTEVTMLPRFAKSTLEDRGKAIPKSLVRTLSLLNLYGWAAYTIYDRILDDENTQSSLPAANFFLRELTEGYFSLEKNIPGIYAHYKKIMDDIDDANTWEQLHCRIHLENGIAAISPRLPYASNGELIYLAKRSLGHALPAIAIFSYGKSPLNTSEMEKLLSFFTNYLIARQLHDDAHDWSDDLLRGRLNSTSARILRNWRQVRDPAMQMLDLKQSLPELQKFFWRHTIDAVVTDIIRFTDLARNDLSEIPIIQHSESLMDLATKLRQAAQNALSERDEALKFIDAYGH